VQWDPEQYLRFADQRGRPFGDLLARVDALAPRTVADLGCGPGSLTRLLARRWPEARIEAVDSSPEMVARAQQELAPFGGRVDVALADVRTWAPAEPVDVVVSNATLQWVPDHLEVLERLAGAVPRDGWLAVQVPGNFGEPSHTLMHEVARQPRWRDRVGDLARAAVEEPATYLARLAGLGLEVDVWETTYHQVLPGEDAVLAWMRGTGLRPVLSALDAGDRADFETEYGALLRQAYPRQPYGTVLPFRRIFVVAHRPAHD
jgi:trans-aconitate 2-methyltransferase